ncbi:hypothetical protein BJ508DRAFT_307642 [Ascobolus immersus RN42]|uniref:Uncharacterized protein n=1 Tax=Ascobolus immersus RN42 TaxID=1160509 RepID=A0A3N4I6E3_ASCIM|nr:hypothetical protein BJ508DRAFT_307642 [Ascobolus immersus RN42]
MTVRQKMAARFLLAAGPDNRRNNQENERPYVVEARDIARRGNPRMAMHHLCISSRKHSGMATCIFERPAEIDTIARLHLSHYGLPTEHQNNTFELRMAPGRSVNVDVVIVETVGGPNNRPRQVGWIKGPREAVHRIRDLKASDHRVFASMVADSLDFARQPYGVYKFDIHWKAERCYNLHHRLVGFWDPVPALPAVDLDAFATAPPAAITNQMANNQVLAELAAQYNGNGVPNNQQPQPADPMPEPHMDPAAFVPVPEENGQPDSDDDSEDDINVIAHHQYVN